MKKIIKVGRENLEFFIWTFALLGLAIFPVGERLVNLCPIHNLGFDFCPGCGIGTGIAYILHGQLLSGFQTHFLSPFALFILLLRMVHLLDFAFMQAKTNRHTTKHL